MDQFYISVYKNLVGASELGSEIAVLHLWDTFSKDLDLERTFDRAYKVSKHHQIRIAVENIPISDKKLTQETAWGLLTQMMPPDYGFTVDLNWSSLYNNFPQLKRYRHRILCFWQSKIPEHGSVDVHSTLT